MKAVIIDNYDSFTYNLAHAVKALGAETEIVRNDRFKLGYIGKYDKIILSPGPGIPSEAGLLLDVIREYAGKKPSRMSRSDGAQQRRLHNGAASQGTRHSRHTVPSRIGTYARRNDYNKEFHIP